MRWYEHFGWGAAWALCGLLVPLGFGALALSPPAFDVARAFFDVAVLVLALRTILSAMQTKVALKIRVGGGVVMSLIAMWAGWQTDRWVVAREAAAAPAQTAARAQPPWQAVTTTVPTVITTTTLAPPPPTPKMSSRRPPTPGQPSTPKAATASPPIAAGPGSIITQNQTGGSNLITNTFMGPPRWGLTPQQERALLEALRGTHGDVRLVTVATGDAESIQFANQIIGVFRTLGWELRGRKGPDQAIVQPAPPLGIMIRVSSAEVIRANPALLAFHDAMRALGFHVFAGIREMQDDGIEIFVGPRPPQ